MAESPVLLPLQSSISPRRQISQIETSPSSVSPLCPGNGPRGAYLRQRPALSVLRRLRLIRSPFSCHSSGIFPAQPLTSEMHRCHSRPSLPALHTAFSMERQSPCCRSVFRRRRPRKNLSPRPEIPAGTGCFVNGTDAAEYHRLGPS